MKSKKNLTEIGIGFVPSTKNPGWCIFLEMNGVKFSSKLRYASNAAAVTAVARAFPTASSDLLRNLRKPEF